MVSSTRCTPTRSRKNYDTTKTVNRDTSAINEREREREKAYLWSLANMFQQSLDQLLLHCRIAVDPDLKVGIHMQKELTVQLFGIRHGGCQFLEPMHRDASAVVRGSTSVREQITNQLEAMRRAHLVLVQSAIVTHGRSLAAKCVAWRTSSLATIQTYLVDRRSSRMPYTWSVMLGSTDEP